jgi:hypothetical protein
LDQIPCRQAQRTVPYAPWFARLAEGVALRMTNNNHNLAHDAARM